MRSQWNENNRHLWRKRQTKTQDKTANVNQPLAKQFSYLPKYLFPTIFHPERNGTETKNEKYEFRQFFIKYNPHFFGGGGICIK